MILIDSKNKRYPLNKSRITIGRHAENDIVINDQYVSGKHAILQQDGDSFILKDNHSANGVVLNRRKKITWHRLQLGDTFDIGGHIFTVKSDHSQQQTSLTINTRTSILQPINQDSATMSDVLNTASRTPIGKVAKEVIDRIVLPSIYRNSEWKVVGLLLTDKAEEFIGKENRIINNLNGGTKIKRKISANKEWSQSYTLENNKTRRKGGSLNFKIPQLAKITANFEEALSEKMAFSKETKHKHEDSFEVEADPHQKVCISIKWKKIWQLGIVSLKNKWGIQIEMPLRVVVGVTFDLDQVTET